MKYQASGSLSKGSKPVVEENISINLSKFKKKGLFKIDTILNFNWEINETSTFKAKVYVKENSLLIAHQCDGKIIKQQIQITSTACHFGGHRKWLLCPLCGTRRMNLYFNDNGYLSCRECNNLGYLSQKKNKFNRLLLNAQKLRTKIGSSYGSIENKPLNMQWETFNNIKYKIYDFEMQGNELFMQWANKCLQNV